MNRFSTINERILLNMYIQRVKYGKRTMTINDILAYSCTETELPEALSALSFLIEMNFIAKANTMTVSEVFLTETGTQEGLRIHNDPDLQ